MTNHHIQSVVKSWQDLQSKPEIMESFYEKLFAIAPHLRLLFPGNLNNQSRKISKVMDLTIVHLESPKKIELMIERLGRYHKDILILPDYYDYMSQAMIETIKERMPEQFSKELEESWRAVLHYISKIMIEAPENISLKSKLKLSIQDLKRFFTKQ